MKLLICPDCKKEFSFECCEGCIIYLSEEPCRCRKCYEKKYSEKLIVCGRQIKVYKK